MEAGWLSQSFTPPAQLQQVDASVPKVCLRAPVSVGPYATFCNGVAICTVLFGKVTACLHTSPVAVAVVAIHTLYMQPSPLPVPTQLTAAMHGIRTDEQLTNFLHESKPGTAVVEFGTAWCLKCYEMFPQFYRLSKQVG